MKHFELIAISIPTRWSATISSKIKLPHTINFRALCDANVVTCSAEFRGAESLVLHRVVSVQCWTTALKSS